MEKNTVKVSLGTVICIVIILILLAVIGYLLLNQRAQKSVDLAQTQYNEPTTLQEVKEQTNTTTVEKQQDNANRNLVYRLAMNELYKYDLLYLDNGTKIQPTNVTITDITIFEGTELTETLSRLSDSQKGNIELIGSIDYTVTYPEEYNGKGSRAGSEGAKYFIVTRVNGEYKIEICTGL